MKWKAALFLYTATFSAISSGQNTLECLPDDTECTYPQSCPTRCCSDNIQIRVDGLTRACYSSATLMPNDWLRPVDPDSDDEGAGELTPFPVPAPVPAPGDGSSQDTPTIAPSIGPSPSVEPTEAPSPASPEPSSPITPETQGPETPTPTKNERVDAYQSTNSLVGGNHGNGLSGGTTIGVVVGAMACVAGLVMAVMQKRKAKSTAEAPFEKGNTPDHHSFDAMLEPGTRTTTGTSHPVPVLSIGNSADAGVRPSSPFGRKHARISSPKADCTLVDDMQFNVEARATMEDEQVRSDSRFMSTGSAVAVAFLDVDDIVTPDEPVSNTEVAL